jgi:hypothetical protein
MVLVVEEIIAVISSFIIRNQSSLNIQGDSKLLSEFSWPLIFKPETRK